MTTRTNQQQSLSTADMRSAIDTVSKGNTLSEATMVAFVEGLVDNKISEPDAKALLVAIYERGDRKSELVGTCRSILSHMVPVETASPDMVDTCGTGGDHSGTFNISTAAAIVAAGAGIPIAKHGNRAATSKCGSADVLETLGVNIELPPASAVRVLKQCGISFFYARNCHPVMANIAALRKTIPHPTIFNRIGPLCHPMRVRRQLIGATSSDLAKLMGEAAIELGATKVWTVSSNDGLDELSTTANSTIFCYDMIAAQSPSVKPRTKLIEAGDLVEKADLTALQGADAAQNAQIITEILAGQTGPKRNIVVLNAAAAINVAGQATSMEAGIKIASESIDSGKAKMLLAEWISVSRSNT